MNRRNGAGPKLVGVAVVILIFIYGLYTHNDVQSKLRTAEEKTERLRQQYDSLSAQLQVVYEHKSRLEKSLQTEKTEHKKTRDDLIARKSEADAKFATQKQELMNRVSALNQEYKMLQSQHEDLQGEYTKLQESLNKLQEDHKQQLEQHNLEFRQMQQDKENDIAKLRDELANLERRYNDNLGKLQGQNQQLSNQLQQGNQELLMRQHQLQQEIGEKRILHEKLERAQLQIQQVNRDLSVHQHQLQQAMREKRDLQEKFEKSKQERQYAKQQQQQGLNANQQQLNQNQQLNQQPQQQFNQQLNQNQAIDQNQQYWLNKNQNQQKVQHLPLQQNFNDNQNLNANLNNQNQGLGFNNNNLGDNFGGQKLQRNQFDNSLQNNFNAQDKNLGGVGGDLNQFGGQNQFDQNKLPNDIPVNQGGQEQLNMQIALPGQDKHPGYHEVKDVDPADKLHHEKEMLQLKPDHNENLPDNKGPVIMQQAAPNLQAKNNNVNGSNHEPNVAGNMQVAPPGHHDAGIHQVAAPAAAGKDSASPPSGSNKNDNLQAPDVRNDLKAADIKVLPNDEPVQAIPAPDLDKKIYGGDSKFADNQNEQMQAAGVKNALEFQAPQPDVKDHNIDTFRNDKIRNHPEILGAGGIQPDPDMGRIKAPVVNDNQQIPLPVHDGPGRDHDDDDEDDKYDDGNDDGQMNQNPQGQVMPPNIGQNDGLLEHGVGNLQENQVPVPNNKNDHNNDLLVQGQPVADHNADYDKGHPVPQGDDNEGDYQEDEDEDNRRMGGRDFQ